MAMTVGIMGFGRIGRNVFRILYKRDDIRIGAVSDLGDAASVEYLLKFDTLFGRFPDELSAKEGHLYVVGRQIALLAGQERGVIPPWGDLGVDTVIEATARRLTRAELERHLAAGARRVILCEPPVDALDLTVVNGINDGLLRREHRIVSSASSTVHCVAPLAKILLDAFGIKKLLFTTMHSYTNQHRLADVPAEDMRRGRAAAENIIPQESRSPGMLQELIPGLTGKVVGAAMNVPVPERLGGRPRVLAREESDRHRDQRSGPHGHRGELEGNHGLRDRAHRLERRDPQQLLVHVRLAGHDGPRRERLQDALVVRRGLGLRAPRRGASRSLRGPGPGGLPMSRIAINGFGRIGRTVYRILSDRKDIEVVAINDLFDNDQLAYLLKYDTVMGVFEKDVRVDGEVMTVDGRRVLMTAEKDPAKLAWGKLGVDVVVEATGKLVTREKLQKHLDAGAKRVVLTVPPKDEIDAMVVVGVNDDALRKEHRIVSNASCTTNCLAPIAKILDEAFGIQDGFMTTVHAYTNDQRLADVAHKDLRRARAAAENIIPTTTGAARAVGKVLPRLKGKLDGTAIRVPVPDGSIVDLSLRLLKKPSVLDVNAAVKAAADGPMKRIVEYSEVPLVSSDIIGNPHSSIFDALSTRTDGDGWLKVVAWYDNEWGYSNRVVDLIDRLVALG